MSAAGWSDIGTGLTSPVIRQDAGGYCSLEWYGPPATPVSREVLENMVAEVVEHNRLVTLRGSQPRATDYDAATDCPTCPQLATDRDDALHNGQLIYLEQQRWQAMAEDLWEELRCWHNDDCPTHDRPDETCTCHVVLAAKWDELTHADDYTDEVNP